ncbi:hypothetical protein ACEPPN_005190 [Leptodophora sp. 'Broadleaf-Isolate-01']
MEKATPGPPSTLAPLNRMAQSTAPTGRKTLDNLPHVVLLCIGDYLSPLSSACLSVCSKKLRDSFLSKYQACIRSSGHEYFKFLTLLSRDLPDHFLCRTCRRLHSNSIVSWPNSSNNNSNIAANGPPSSASLLRCMTVQHQHLLPTRRVDFSQIQVAMKHLKHGAPHGMPISAFNSTKLIDIAKYHGYSFKIEAVHSYEARIVSGELILRTQVWMRTKGNNPSQDQYTELLTSMLHDYHDNLPCRISQCPLKGYVRSFLTAESQSDYNRSRLPWILEGPKGKAAFWDAAPLRCDVATIDVARKGTAMGITTWINYDNGITPKNLGRRMVVTAADRDNFENLGGVTLEEMTDNNVGLLFEKGAMGPGWMN